MPVYNRINFLSFVCSCVGHAALLGGLIYGLADRGMLPEQRRVPAPMIVDLAALDLAATGAAANSERAPAQAGVRRTAAAVSPASTGKTAELLDSADRPTAPATSDVAGAVTAVLPGTEAESGSASAPFDFSTYQRQLYEAVARGSRYPPEARRLRLSGVTRIAFRVDRSGKVLDSWISESSGARILDDAALAALQRAQPLPPMPAALPAPMDFSIEIDLSVIQHDAGGPVARP